MTFRILYSDESESELRKLDNKTAARIMDKLDDSAKKPTHFFERLAGRDEYKLRAGDFRIIVKILFDEKSIFIMSIGHRKNIYKR